MNKLLDEYLCKKYPKIFRDRHAPMTQTCLCWGFSHGNGWFFLINTLCSNIQSHIDQHNNWVEEYGKKFYEERKAKGEPVQEKDITPISQVVAAQVKEKFGGLRFYYDGGDEIIQGMVQLTESLSYRVCEECGAMNETVNSNDGGWIQTTCSECVQDSRRESHEKNRRSELIEIWQKIKEEKKRNEQ